MNKTDTRRRYVVLTMLCLLAVSSFISCIAQEEGWSIATIHSPEPGSDRNFGTSVAYSDGIMVVGEPRANILGIGLTGMAYVYDSEGKLMSTLQASEPEVSANFGVSVAVSGEAIVIGQCGSWYMSTSGGTVNVFRPDGNIRATLRSDTPEEDFCFGSSVAVSGDTVVVADQWRAVGDSLRAGRAYVFDSDGALISTLQSPSPGSYQCFGRGVAVGGDTVAVGEVKLNAGGIQVGPSRAHIFDVDGSLRATVQPPEPETSIAFGSSMAVGGGVVVVGDSYASVEGLSRAGRAYVYDSDGNFLRALQAPEPEGNAEFGRSVSVAGESIVVGEYKADVDVLNEGKVYLFDLDGALLGAFQAPDPEVSANFGYSVAISGDTVVIAEPAASVEGDAKAGRVHVFSPGAGGEPEPEPEPEAEHEEADDSEPGGVPGFPYESMTLGLVAGALILVTLKLKK